MKKLLWALALAPLGALFAAAVSLPLSSEDWQGFCQLGNPCSRGFFSDNRSGQLTFEFPVVSNPTTCYDNKEKENDDCPSVNYLFYPQGSGFAQKPAHSIANYASLTLNVKVTTTGSPVWFYMTDANNTCSNPAAVRAFLWQWDDAATGGDRWWSSPVSWQLQPGTASITTPLSPSQWSNVNGASGTEDPSGWNDALNHIEYLGMTFGGGCFFGHGVNISGGTAQFTLLGYTLQ